MIFCLQRVDHLAPQIEGAAPISNYSQHFCGGLSKRTFGFSLRMQNFPIAYRVRIFGYYP